MLWSATSNSRVVVTNQHRAFVFDNYGEEGGFVASIYDANKPGGPECSRWGRTINASLRCVIKAFDPEAELPHSILEDTQKGG